MSWAAGYLGAASNVELEITSPENHELGDAQRRQFEAANRAAKEIASPMDGEVSVDAYGGPVDGPVVGDRLNVTVSVTTKG